MCSGYQIKVLKGRDHVFGVAFRPGSFRPFLGASVSRITDRVVPATEVFGSDLPTRLDVPTVDAFLLKHLPDDDPRGRQAVAAVELIAKDKAVTRVERLADELGLSMRGLQRLFAEYVGIGPKWVIRRYRLHEVTARMAAGGGDRLGRAGRGPRLRRPGPLHPRLQEHIRRATGLVRAAVLVRLSGSECGSRPGAGAGGR